MFKHAKEVKTILNAKEFKSNGWPIEGLKRMKNATHYKQVVKLCRDEDGERAWEDLTSLIEVEPLK